MDKILAAVSGGADSAAMLHILVGGGKTVVCAHYNHGLRPSADADEIFVRNLCGQWGVPFVSEKGDVEAGRRGRGIEETARQMRYEFLERARERTGMDFIATAHTADDNVETVLLNLIRGSGLLGLCGIPPERGNIIRPLLCLSRDDIERYLREHNIPHIEDGSNADRSYRRNFIRHDVMPLLKAANPSLAAAVTRLTELLREDEVYLSGLAREEWERNGELSFSKGNGVSFPAARLNGLPKPVASRVCRIMAASLGPYPPERVHIGAMLDIARGGNGRKTDMAGKLTAEKFRNRLIVYEKFTKGCSTCTMTSKPSC